MTTRNSPALAPSAFDDKDLPYPDVKLRPAGFVDDFTIAEDAFIAANATLMGTVTVGARSSVWYNCVLRGDIAEIVIGEDANIQDGAIVHCRGRPFFGGC